MTEFITNILQMIFFSFHILERDYKEVYHDSLYIKRYLLKTFLRFSFWCTGNEWVWRTTLLECKRDTLPTEFVELNADEGT